LNISSTLRTTKKRVALEMIEAAVDQALEDHRFTSQERDALGALADRMEVSSQELTAIVGRAVQPLMDEEVRRVVADGRYSLEEEADLKAFATALGANLTSDATSTAALASMRRLWLIENGQMPILTSPISLKRGETLHFTSPATWSELRTRTKTIRYSGPTASIRIMKGVRYRVGAISPIRETTTELVPVQTGTLYITNKRALIDGASGNKAIPWGSVFGIEIFSDAVKLEKASGKDPYLIVAPESVEELSLIVTTLLDSAQD
jgi:hypothetical protein